MLVGVGLADLEPGWLTITEIARRLRRSPSTVKYWRDRYQDLLPEQTDADGHLCYPLATFERIAGLYRRRAPPNEIRDVLVKLRGGEQPPEPDVLEQILAEVRAVRDDLASLRELVELIAGRLPRNE